MNTYSKESHPNLYEEILKDYHYRFPKFSPIPYPGYAELKGKVKQTVPVLNPKPSRKLPK